MLWSASGEELIFSSSNLVVALNVTEDDGSDQSHSDDTTRGGKREGLGAALLREMCVSCFSAAPGPASEMDLSVGSRPKKPRSQRHFRGHTADVAVMALRCFTVLAVVFCAHACATLRRRVVFAATMVRG